jgi:hypothetical protein
MFKGQSLAELGYTGHVSKPVDIPADFLKETLPDSQPITVQKIDFSNSPLQEYGPYYAVVLDNVLSASECATLLRLAVEGSGTRGNWEKATVGVGTSGEVLVPEVRLCERRVGLLSCFGRTSPS